jgi:hypothetical protein
MSQLDQPHSGDVIASLIDDAKSAMVTTVTADDFCRTRATTTRSF